MRKSGHGCTRRGSFLVATASLPDGVTDEDYGNESLTAVGGTGDYAWTLASGTLPPGLALSPSGEITGIPTSAGLFEFTVEVASGTQTAKRALSITVEAGFVPLQWPVAGKEGADWVINNYVDLDPGPGVLDYQGGVRTYGHFKRNAIVVAIGQQVSAGQTLAVVGSSGCSTQPHLHLELLSSEGELLDPSRDGLWDDAPSYDPPLDLMDLMDLVVMERSRASMS